MAELADDDEQTIMDRQMQDALAAQDAFYRTHDRTIEATD